MVTRTQQREGTGFRSRIRTMVDTELTDKLVTSLIENQDQDTFFDWREELLAISSTVPGGKTDYSPTGAPVFAIAAGGVGGWVSATLASDNAAMMAGLSWDDNLQIASDRYYCKGSRVMFLDALTTAEYALMGVSGAIETGVNPGTLAGWVGAAFYLDASMVLRVKIVDGNGLSVNESLGLTVDTDVPYWYWIERDGQGINFYWGPQYGEDGGQVYATSSVTPPNFSASQRLQPIDLVGKSTGATTPAIYVDCQKGHAHRGIPS